MTTRQPQFADDRWYPSTAEALQREVDGFLVIDPNPRKAVGVVAPHAGWFYSGAVAGALYGAIEVPDRVVVVCPNHRGMGARRSIMAAGAWRMPAADIPIDSDAAAVLMEQMPWLVDDEVAHSREHSLEVQLPFLWRRNPSFRLVPICLYPQSKADCERFGRALAMAVRQLEGHTLIVASSDMNHHEPAVIGGRKDRLAIDRVLALDPDGLYDTVRGEDISMCGMVPAAIMLHAALELGATRAELIEYADSGDAGGDKTQVVGYAGMTVAV